MSASDQPQYIAFEGATCLAYGALRDVALAVKAAVDRGVEREVLVFDSVTSNPVEIDTRGTEDDVLARLPIEPKEATPAPARGRGRPKLGVVAREVTLLPRHWDWLKAQPGGASVTLRKLVEQARRGNDRGKLKSAQESAYRFMSAVAGDLTDFEDATRALFAGDKPRFAALVTPWPQDVRDHANRLADAVFEAIPPPDTG